MKKEFDEVIKLLKEELEVAKETEYTEVRLYHTDKILNNKKVIPQITKAIKLIEKEEK